MRDSALARLGWRAFHRRSLAAAPHGLVPARVTARDRGRVLVHDGERERPAPLAGRLLHGAAAGDELPVVGDWVGLGAGGAVEAVLLPRRGVLRRPGQLLASGVDLVLITHALAEDPHVARLPRLLAVAAESGADVAVLLTKADLLGDVAAGVATLRATVGGGAPVLPVCAATGDGVEAVRALVAPGRTAALAGASGAGKSTLVNALLGEERQRTGAVRASDGRGRHVTVRRELLELPGAGLLIDMPGLRLVKVRGSTDAAFGDVEAAARRCRFGDCSHGDEPGCAVRGAVAPERLAAWRKLAREADWQAARDDERLRRARERRSRAVVTQYRLQQRRGRGRGRGA